MAALWLRFKGWILAAVAAGAALLYAWQRGRAGAQERARLNEQAARADRNSQAAQEMAAAAKDRTHVENDIDRMSPDAISERLRRDWSKD